MKRLYLLTVFILGLCLAACQINLDRNTIRVPTEQADIAQIITRTPTEQANIAQTEVPTVTPLPAAVAVSTPVPEPKPGGQITIGLVGALDSLNPLKDLGQTLNVISPLLYQPLNQIDPTTAQPLAGLAALPEVSDDGLSVTFTLPNKMSDTQELAQDIGASIEASLWPELNDIRRVAVVGSDSVDVILTVPNCALVDRLAQLPILAAETVEDVIPLGMGPFQVEDWDAERQELRLVRNVHYVGETPWLEAIVVRFFENERLAQTALQLGAIDILPRRTQSIDTPIGYRQLAYPAPRRIFVTFNHQDEYLQLPEVRQALRLAVDRVVVLKALNDQGWLSPGPFHPDHWVADTTLTAPPFDAAQAESLLDAADLIDRDGDGWRDLPDGSTWMLPIRVSSNNVVHTTIAYQVADAYRHIGIRSRAELVSLAALLDDLLTYDYQTAVYGLPVAATVDQRSYWHSDQVEATFGLNLAAYANPDVDELLDEVNQRSNCNPTDRIALYKQLQQQLVADNAMDFLLIPNDYVIVSDALHGVSPTPFAPFTWNARMWHIADSPR